MNIKLFCLPYAGGTAHIYRSWYPYLNKNIELIPVEMSGKGSRFGEEPYKDINGAITDIYNIIIKHMEDTPYILYGHSMGALLIYELMNEIKKNNKPEPIHIFYSGSQAPHTKSNDNELHLLDDDLFAQKIMSLGGTPNEIFNNKELYELFIPILKLDYKLINEYRYVDKDMKASCNISILTGIDDSEINTSELLEWKKYTTQKCEIIRLPGGHFFINDAMEQITSMINNVAQKYQLSTSLSI